MKLDHRDFEDARVVSFGDARIDAACAIQFKDEMRALSETGPDRLVLDMENVEFLDSSGLGAVVATLKAVRSGQTLELAALRPTVNRVFHLTRMDTVFTIHQTVDDALRHGDDVS
ncbi:STAS domain-containing protein [Celeribacter litoreus]|uniref:STAS domain-containing protein n=1 Tax=Celeribacter litoreus TaxID=2876714 RepID=UPI001CCD09AA|nr:STAS domain-containing protein [Celeribacter litoreus]MCA0041908.1 STAS domain-containing protein [Celeribacter litoreus]